MCLCQHLRRVLPDLPDGVGDLADAEAAGRLHVLPALPPHIPLVLRHKFKRLHNEQTSRAPVWLHSGLLMSSEAFREPFLTWCKSAKPLVLLRTIKTWKQGLLSGRTLTWGYIKIKSCAELQPFSHGTAGEELRRCKPGGFNAKSFIQKRRSSAGLSLNQKHWSSESLRGAEQNHGFRNEQQLWKQELHGETESCFLFSIRRIFLF